MHLFDKITNLFKVKKEVCTSRPGARTYYMGGSWGNLIRWSDIREFSHPARFFSVHGYKSPKPVEGDLLFAKMEEDRVAIFIFTQVKYPKSTNDLFIARVGFSKFVDEQIAT